MSVCENMIMIKDVSRESRELKFRRKLSKSAGQTSPLVSEQVIVNKVYGKTVCKLQVHMDRHHIYQRPEGAYYSDMSRNLTTENRQRMQPWLESRINSRDIDGLEWINKDQKIFKVPWKHVGNREWSERDGIIFREWAIHTGRFREGIDQPDWPTWKTRFRCALTKLPGIEELKHLNKLDGQTDEPFRVYKFVPKKTTGGESITFSPPYDSQFMDDSDSSQHSAMDFTPDPIQNRPIIPTTVSVVCKSETDVDITDDDRLPSDIQGMDSGDLMQLNSAEVRNLSYDTGGESFKMHVLADVEAIANKPFPGHNNSPPTLNKTDTKMFFSIKYLLETVHEEMCSDPDGCRIFFDRQVNVNQRDYEQFYGPAGAKQIPLPNCNMQNPNQHQLTQNLLGATDRGVVIKVKDGNIYVTRKCRCRIYVSHPTLSNNCEILRLERDVETLVFNLVEYFKPAMERFLYEKGPKPFTKVVIGFGQNFMLDQESLNNLLVSATVVHVEAYNHLSQIVNSSPHLSEIEQSESTPTDQLLEVLRYTQEP